MTSRHPSLHVYERTIDLSERTSLSVIASQIPPHARILDLGCGSGAIGQYLMRQGPVTIDGLTISEDEAVLARAVYRRVDVANLDNCDLVALFGQGQYDVIVCADVLEHVRGSERVLAQCAHLLAPGGKALLSIPNASYSGLIAELMAGEFRYRKEGLLDETHVRFFTRQTLLRFLQSGGWAVDNFEVIERVLNESEFQVAFDTMPPGVAAYLLALPDALTYQFIVSTHPTPAALQAQPLTGAQSTALTDASPVPAQALFSAELFVGMNGAFAQDNKLRASGVIGQSPQTLRFALPQVAFNALKFDPADRPGFFRFFGLRLFSAQGQLLWQWQAGQDPRWLTQAESAGIAFPPAWDMAPALVGLLYGNDPWIRLPVPANALQAALGGQLELDVGWPMSADYMALAGAAQDLQLTIDQLRDTLAQGDQQRGDLSQQLHTLQSRLAHSSAHMELLSEQNDALRQQKQAILSQCNVLSHERDQAVAHVFNIENSTVFRATRPIVNAKMRMDRLLGRNAVAADSALTAIPESHPIAPNAHPVDVIVPVYKGLADTQLCVNSVLQSNCQTPWRLVIINDASPEPAVTDWLREVAPTDARILLLENEENLGFVGTVNRGMAVSGDNDVLLLNSDAEVANDWLDRIRASAYSDRKVASVTPFSNNATICSYPQFCKDNELASGWTTAELDQLMASTNPGEAIDVPTGVGFCMYIRRDALSAVGLFDVENFGKGYGEENDFCIRAESAGWRNLHLLDTFVHHSGGVSFGDAKSPRERAAMLTLRRLHPKYEGDVIRFLKRDPAELARIAADVRRVLREPLPVIVAVLHDRAGGTERHVNELAQHLHGKAVFFVMRPAPGQRLSLRLAGEAEAFELMFQLPDELDALVDVLRALGVSHMHFQHLLGHDERVLDLPRRLGVAYDFTAHDFFTLCPQITLTDKTNAYCGEEGVKQCTDCLAHSPAPTGEDILTWRKRHADFLLAARYVLAPSRDVLGRLHQLSPAAALRHVPHTDIAPGTVLPEPNPQPLTGNRPLRVVVIGALSIIKGADLLEDVAVAARKQGQPVDFHLIGYGYRSLRTLPKANLTVHGKYEDKDLPELLEWLQPDVVWFPAQWPETYSYTLSACLKGGWPVVAPNLGAFAERLVGRPWTWVRPWHENATQWLQFFAGIRTRNFEAGNGPARPIAIESEATRAALSATPAQPPEWYAQAYLQDLPVHAVQGPARSVLDAHLPKHYRKDAAAETRGVALSALVWARNLPVLSSLARIIPLRWQTRVKSWLLH